MTARERLIGELNSRARIEVYGNPGLPPTVAMLRVAERQGYTLRSNGEFRSETSRFVVKVARADGGNFLGFR